MTSPEGKTWEGLSGNKTTTRCGSVNFLVDNGECASSALVESLVTVGMLANMTHGCLKHHLHDESHLPPSQKKKDDDFRASASQIGSLKKGSHIPLKKPAGAIWRIRGLEDTVYHDCPTDVNGLKRQLRNVSHLPPSKKVKDDNFLAHVSQYVSSKKGECITLENPAGAIWRIGGLEDTVYKDCPIDVNGWGKFYLPKIVTMKVIGVVEGIPCPCEQLVLMTCEDKQVYAYDEEELHLVASSMEQLRDEGMEYPASKTYYNGEAFKNMTKKDWEKVRQGPVGRRLDEEHKKLVATRKPRLLDYLKQKQMIKSC